MRPNLQAGAALLVVLGGLALAGCGSVPVKTLPVQFERTSQEFAVKLETPSRLVVLEGLPAGKACDPRRRELSLHVRGNGADGNGKGDISCTLLAKHLVLRTQDVYGKGEYVVNASGSGRKPPRVTADPEDPEALSGPDQDFAGAVALAENGTLKGSVNYSGANATNWVQIDGAKGSVSLLFLPEPGGEVEAKVFVLRPGATVPVRAGGLLPKQKRTVASDGGAIYIKVFGKRFSGETGFSLVRKDLAKVKSTSIAVLDFYPVDGKSSLLLLPAHDGLKADTSLRVTGMRAGKSVSLGRCTVTSSSPTQAGCRMDGIPSNDVSKLQAELVEGGST